MKLVLIGATGFVGSHLLTEALSRNHQVTAIVRDPGNLQLVHNNLMLVKGDALNIDSLVIAFKGHDAVLSAYNAGWKNPGLYDEFLKGSANIQEACKLAGVQRLLVVGGAGSLELSPGKQVVDDPNFPAEWKEGAMAARDYLKELRKESKLDWVFLSPALQMNPGTSGIRTGTYRTGKDQPVFDGNKISKISVEDTAVALLDEAEKQHHHQERFTVAW